MHSLLPIAACLLTLAALGARPAVAAIVYDNAATRTGGFVLMQGNQFHSMGNELFLAGNQRTLTGIDIGLFSNATVQQSVQMRIFANDGPAGQPSTKLWESPVTTVSLGLAEQRFSFPINNVAAPDTITWTITHLGPMSQWVILYFYNPPAVGSHAPYEWSHNNGWFKAPQTISSNLWHYGVRVHAVPEPAAALVVLAAFAAPIHARTARRPPHK